MPILFNPRRGQILMCDFKGFIPPEMQKIRHCIVVSPERRSGTCIVVPLSTSSPKPEETHHYKIPRNAYQCLECGVDVWAKADMLTHAAFARLDRPKEHGKFASRQLSPADLEGVINAVLAAIGQSVSAQVNNPVEEKSN
jgi:mRNA interferase MazF